MDTIRSDRFVRQWIEKDNPLRRASIYLEKQFNTSPEILFPLFCPARECDWIPGWNCELLHSGSGYAEYNFVIRTDFFGVDEYWICTRYESNRAIEFSRTAEDLCVKVDISIADNLDGTVTGRWEITASALNEKGNWLVTNIESVAQHFEVLIADLEHYVETGAIAL